MDFFVLMAAALMSAPSTGPSVKAGIEAWSHGDAATAIANWRPLAAKGNPDAMFNLGQLYRLGRGVPIDLAAAEAWYTKAARAGHVDAQTQLGMLLFQNGFPRAAVMWLQRAADKGDARAELLYGTALYNGDGVPKRDVLLAHSYVAKAAAQGLGPAKTTLAEMDRGIPPQPRGMAVAETGSKPAVPSSRPATASAVAPPPRKVAKAASPPIAAPAGGGWRVQLGAFGQRGAAESQFSKVAGALAGRQPYFIPVGAMTRLQAGPFASRAEATAACALLAARGQPCFTVPPGR